MNNIQIMQLKKFCQKHELDTQLIDSKISYTENRQYLETLVIKTFKSFSDLDHHGDRMLESRLHEWNAAEEEYLANHFLWYYLICIKEGANKSAKVGKVQESEPRFSLRDMRPIEHGFSLKSVPLSP